MLVIAAHVLGDIKRWGNQLKEDPDRDAKMLALYEGLYATTREAEASWSVLEPRADGSRTFSATTPQFEIDLQLYETGDWLIVWDVRVGIRTP